MTATALHTKHDIGHKKDRQGNIILLACHTQIREEAFNLSIAYVIKDQLTEMNSTNSMLQWWTMIPMESWKRTNICSVNI